MATFQELGHPRWLAAATLGSAGGGYASHGRNFHRFLLLETAELGVSLFVSLLGLHPAIIHVAACEIPRIEGGRKKRRSAALSASRDGDIGVILLLAILIGVQRYRIVA